MTSLPQPTAVLARTSSQNSFVQRLRLLRIAILSILSLAPHSHAQTARPSGTVVSWGGLLFPYIDPGTRFTAIAAGTGHTLALKTDGSVVAWGLNSDGQTKVPLEAQRGIGAVAAGNYHSLALMDDGSVAAWGLNNAGQLTVPVEAKADVVAIAAGAFHSVALKSDGAVVTWGGGQTTAQSGVIAISAGGLHTVALKQDGSVVAWGDNSSGQTDVPVEAQTGVIAIAAAGYGEGSTSGGHTVVLKNDGSVLAWGDNTYGQTDVPITAQSEVMAIAAGALAAPLPGSGVTTPGGVWTTSAHTLALKTDGSVVAWGDNTYGQIEVPFAAQSGVIAIAAGGLLGVLPWGAFITGGHSLALKSNGSVLAWGNNEFGQTDVPVEAQNEVVAIAAGNGHSVALKSDGSVVAWGWNDYGQTTVPAEAQSEVIAIAAGFAHTVALKSDGSVVAWSDATVPDAAKSGVIAIAAGLYHTLALKTNGLVVAWGDNGYGQTTVPVAARSGVVAIAAGHVQSVALKSDGSVVAWGANNGGQSTVPSGLPTPLALLATCYSTYALVRDPLLALTILRNADQTATLSWTGAGALEQSDSLASPNWQAADSQPNPQSISPTGTMKFFRVKGD